ncbi:MAG: carbohydrate-binding protein [Fibrobacter sp.]|nr:carbohydrate-binding protein [Fibrobacter sp.]
MNIRDVWRALAVFMSMASASVVSAETLKVDLTDSIRPVTHVATGSLYGMTETLPSNIDQMVAPLKPNTFLNPAIAGNGHQQPIGDAFKVAERLKNTTGKVHIRLADILPGWPYSYKGQSEWLKSVEEIIRKKLNSGLTNFDGYEIWNEPDGTWKDANGDFHATLWKPTYDLIRKLDPDAKIIGPSYSWLNSSRIDAFLKYTSQNNCVPDVISWHQWGSEGFVGSYETVRNTEKKYGITPRAISINEYSSNEHTYEGAPGISVPFIAKFERYGVESAMISWWFTNLPGRLGSLLTANNEKGGGWHLYKWYGDMSGYMARVTPPNDKSDKVDGFAAVDAKNNYASVVLGGNSVGNVDVVFDKLPAFLGGKVKVMVERVVWKNKDTAVPSTDVVSEKEMTVEASGLKVSVNVESQFYGYRIYMTPIDVPLKPYNNNVAEIPGRIEAENYDVAGQGFSYSDKDSENKGGAYREDGVDIEGIECSDGKKCAGYVVGYTNKDEWMKYTVNVKEAGDYKVTANVAAADETAGFALYMDDELLTSDYTIAATGEDWKTYKQVDIGIVKLSAGNHVLKLQIVGDYVNIDWVEFYNTVDTIPDAMHVPLAGKKYTGEVEYFDLQGNKINKAGLKKAGVYLKRVRGGSSKLIRIER